MAVDWTHEIRRAYREILGREPEAGAVEYYLGVVNQGLMTSVSQLREEFRRSPEAAIAAEREVTKAYRDILGRDPDPGGLTHYVALLTSGAFESITQMRNDIAASNEAARRGSPEQRSARTVIVERLREWGLESLGDWAWEQIRLGNAEQLPMLIREREEYKTRFSGLEARRAAGLNVMSEAEYLQLENNYREVMRRYGIPTGAFDTHEYLGNLIARDLSPNELNDRLRVYQDAAFNAPAEVRSSLSRLYGVDIGGLTAFFIDPERSLPVLEAQYQAAGAASAAERAGFALFGRDMAERLAQLGAGAGSVDSFEQLDRSRELFGDLGFTRETGMERLDEGGAAEAAFGGNAGGLRAMRSRAERRVAEFAGGGGFATTGEGVTGLGSATT